MTLEELKKSGHIIFECISGSRAYGLDTASSDTDIRGVFILPESDFYSLDYIGQINNESNDIVYYELRKFIDLCANNNPNILEMLNVPERCVLHRHPLFKTIAMNLFLSKQCESSFANYAYSQIKKARGLEKKIVNPMEKERKSILDFCYVLDNGKSIDLKTFLSIHELNPTNCGLSRIPHMRDCYNLYHSIEFNFSGIVRNETSNDVSLSNIPKGENPIAMFFFNKDGYSSYCKKYREYWDWVEKRNDVRYSTTIVHGKNYDAKNMMHTFRLLHMAKEIAVQGKIIVERPDRDFLLEIKEGKYEYEELVEKAEYLKEELIKLYKTSHLPNVPDIDLINALLIRIRKEFYSEVEQL
jgi:hypothetical protein